MKVICPYCNEEPELLTTEEFYGQDYGTNVYSCKPCDAYVGTHKRTEIPKGTLAKKELRELRKQAHRAFDPLWRTGKMTRKQAYKYLQDVTGLPKEKAHIAMMNEEQCQSLINHFKTNTDG